MKKLGFLLIVFIFTLPAFANLPQYSKAGFFPLENSGRNIYNFNVGWRFYKGSADGAERKNYDDSNWDIVNCPHGLELNNTECSGGANYQGEAWYRKHFSLPSEIDNKIIKLHFEAIMGKCKIWLNGQLLKTHYGGYLPFQVDLTDHLSETQKNVLAVQVDNSNDPNYPPGKPQETLDFTYFGGIYRDVWLVATNSTYITNPNAVDEEAGGGLFFHVKKLSKQKTEIAVKTHIKNLNGSNKSVILESLLKDETGKIVARTQSKQKLQSDSHITQNLSVKKPVFWSPDNPYLYDLEIRLLDSEKNCLDGVMQKVGMRTIEFRGKDGFYLNGTPFSGKLMGANRHQDHAYVGNALPNSGQWRDAKLLKEAGCNIVRAAHYPADPAFMDACDRLGLFFIVATPGWQFWNDDNPAFEQRVYNDIRNMVRRDRNHPAVIMWEPILNESYYPIEFTEKAHRIVHDEYPYQGAYTVCDLHARGNEFYDVVYSHPFKRYFWTKVLKPTPENYKEYRFDYAAEERSVFTREWGDNVDDWNAQNSTSRIHRSWGEKAQLVQANHYENPNMIYTSWESLYQTPRQHVGGALWHAFDHQRGYHPDPFYGGIMDAFRQPKYSYFLFKSQKDPHREPVLYIANELTPVSGADVQIFSNCDDVRLIVNQTDTLLKKKDPSRAMPHPSFVFKNVYHFKETTGLIAEGIIDGRVVITKEKKPALRPAKIKLEPADSTRPLIANGSDIITLIASITDDNGNAKRLNNSTIHFKIDGPGRILNNRIINANPKPVGWGTAPVLVQSTVDTGKITVSASLVSTGINRPVAATIDFYSRASDIPLIYSEKPVKEKILNQTGFPQDNGKIDSLKKTIETLKRDLNRMKLKEVEKQQESFIGN